MKRIIYIIGLAALVGCSDFLGQQPQGKLTQDVFFGEEKGVAMGVNAIYSNLRKWDQLGFPWFIITELPGDNSDPGSELSDGGTASMYRVNNFTFDAGLGELNNWWTGNYNGVANCNMVLDNMGGLADSPNKVKYTAQALFFRGFFYFNLVRAFGGVPLMLHVPQPDEYNLPRNTEEEVYAAIISDLTYAASNLPVRSEWGASEAGRVSKGTAEGLLAKVYLFHNQPDSAFKYAGRVVARGEYDLHADYRDLFSPNSLYSVEVMLGDQFLWQPSRDDASEYVKWQGVRQQFGWGYMAPTASLAAGYETGDPRREATIFFDGDSVPGWPKFSFAPTLSPRANHKTIWPVSFWNAGDFARTNAHLYFLRFADVLLIYAEAANEIGETAIALSNLERVRVRARNSAATPGVLPQVTETNKELLRNIIWNERRVELALEGHRFFDLIRANKIVPGYALTALQADNPATSFDPARNSLFPIPQTQIDISNGVLKQNE